MGKSPTAGKKHAFLKTALVSALSVGCIIVATISLWPSPRPLKVNVIKIEPAGIWDDADKEMKLVTLMVTNSTKETIYCKGTNEIPVWIDGKWTIMSAELPPFMDSLYATQCRKAFVLVPKGTTSCKVQIHFAYCNERWKTRFITAIGLKGRTLLSKSKWLCKLVWPDQNKASRYPKDWQMQLVKVLIQ